MKTNFDSQPKGKCKLKVSILLNESQNQLSILYVKIYYNVMSISWDNRRRETFFQVHESTKVILIVPEEPG